MKNWQKNQKSFPLSTLSASTNRALNLRSIKSRSDLTQRPWEKKKINLISGKHLVRNLRVSLGDSLHVCVCVYTHNHQKLNRQIYDDRSSELEER